MSKNIKIVPFGDIENTNLIVDAVYEGKGSSLAYEPIKTIIPGLQNLGGFRYSGKGYPKKVVVLYSTREEKDWPDFLDPILGEYSYYGDNRKPGFELHETRPGGNKILRQSFEDIHTVPNLRNRVSPFFIFWKHPTRASNRSVQFKGLAVPGLFSRAGKEDLVAVWKNQSGQRFQNYLANFTILDEAEIKREWLKDILRGDSLSVNAPHNWAQWVKTGRAASLRTIPKINFRTKEQQLPRSQNERDILLCVYEYFKGRDDLFEQFAGEIYEMSDPNAHIDVVTRRTVDGGRDAIGRHVMGMTDDRIEMVFSLEAKCWNIISSCGVRHTSRLISRIRHRQYGVFVTTSFVGKQAYEEIRGDGHPIIIISGGDIARILIHQGLNTEKTLNEKLQKQYPKAKK